MSSPRLGVLGGSFDPVHEGHLELARRAHEQLRLDEVWLIPALSPPHKPDRKLASAEHRLAMLRRATEDMPGLVVSTFEIDNPDLRYSVDTMEALRREIPEAHWYILLGEDSLRDLTDWRDPGRLMHLAVPVVMPRPGVETRRPTRAYGVPIVWLEGEPLDLASTQLRSALGEDADTAGIPPRVLQYIREHGLYQEPA